MYNYVIIYLTCDFYYIRHKSVSMVYYNLTVNINDYYDYNYSAMR